MRSKQCPGNFNNIQNRTLCSRATFGGLKPHFLQNISIPRNGYIYIYWSNESNINVFFDNLEVVHTRGALLEETHYYPFGLTMSGISSKAAGMVENKKKYNGIEFENDLELNVYDAQFRELDAQTGRWWQIDPKTDEMYMWSTYASNFDNPIRYEDYLGDEPEEEQCCGGLKQYVSEVWSGVKERVGEYTSNEGLMSLAFPAASLTSSFVSDPKGTATGIGQTVYNGSIFGTVNNAVNNPKELGKSFVDAAAVVVTEKIVGATTGGVPKGTVDLYRGVNESSPAYGKSVKGEVQPRGGSATPAEHNAGNTKSNYTSWTTNPAVAKNYSLRPGGNGVVLKTTVPKSSTVKSPSLKSVNLKQSPGTVVNESEVLLKGRVKAKVVN